MSNKNYIDLGNGKTLYFDDQKPENKSYIDLPGGKRLVVHGQPQKKAKKKKTTRKHKKTIEIPGIGKFEIELPDNSKRKTQTHKITMTDWLIMAIMLIAAVCWLLSRGGTP